MKVTIEYTTSEFNDVPAISAETKYDGLDIWEVGRLVRRALLGFEFDSSSVDHILATDDELYQHIKRGED